MSLTPQEADQRHVWHPFTKLHPPGCGEPARIIVRGEGTRLWDESGRCYFDGNSSIWTCLHGHADPVLQEAVTNQLAQLDHVSALGLANDQAALLAAELCEAMSSRFHDGRVMFSSDGSSAVEAALKILHLARRLRGEPARRIFISFGGAYHGDTTGAMSVSQSGKFHDPFRDLMFSSISIPPPACYRCPHNRAAPERGVDARLGRKCHWECLDDLKNVLQAVGSEFINALWAESPVQGAAGFQMHPPGYLTKASEILEEQGVWLACDEILTGSGRCGPFSPSVEHGARPQVVTLGKSLSGGALPLAATMVSREIAEIFEQSHSPVFYHGHSYSGHPPACAAARASLRLLREQHGPDHRKKFSAILCEAGQIFWSHPNVGDVRCEGGILAIELVADFATREPFPTGLRVGAKVCNVAAELGLLTRPVGDVLVLMPPLCATEDEITRMSLSLYEAVSRVLVKA